ncbi:hypothetical protein H2200_000118 [Cladophialophora chaetospira]|uniref:Uncharacterized protein n=1 Tax=Cladophialophora chaetospira TaxID=386627 RepID=A0AA38XMT6_9EURO|nr:hypothetical protein H2200_000118 [Cladophialophora chaetospira]
MAKDKSLSDAAKENPTALGDPVSLKAEKSESSPTENDRPNQSSKHPALQGHQQGIKQLAPTEQDIDSSTESQSGDKEKKSLKEVAEEDLKGAKEGNRSMIGDPTSLKAETSDGDPVTGEEEDGTGRGGGAPTKARDSKL